MLLTLLSLCSKAPYRADSTVHACLLCLDKDVLLTMCLPPVQSVGGAENVVGIIPNGVKRDAAAENPDALLMKPKDAATAAELRKRLVMSASQMANVAGLLQARISRGFNNKLTLGVSIHIHCCCSTYARVLLTLSAKYVQSQTWFQQEQLPCRLKSLSVSVGHLELPCMP